MFEVGDRVVYVGGVRCNMGLHGTITSVVKLCFEHGSDIVYEVRFDEDHWNSYISERSLKKEPGFNPASDEEFLSFITCK